MILVFSKHIEFSTDEVLKWLSFFGADYIRVNEEDKLDKIECITPFGFKIWIKGKLINYDNISSYWLRRGCLAYQEENLINETHQVFRVQNMLIEESIVLLNYIEFLFSKKATITHKFNADVNKLILLNIAQSCGLKIPETLVTQNKGYLKEFLFQHSQIITKPIDNGAYLQHEDSWMPLYTQELQLKDILVLNELFLPVKVQINIVKKYELRIFYLLGKFYSMAIFSQQSEQTSVDFRKYNLKKPNTTVPFLLPQEIEDKLTLMMEKCGLNTGSIDMIVDKNNNFYFLEVNPVGQFGMTSYPCNYYLEKIIAKILSA